MIILHLKAAITSITRRRLASFVSIASLAVGIAVSALIALFLVFETSFDTDIPESERLYRINWVNKGTGARFATFFNPMSARIAEAMPGEIETLTRFTQSNELITVEGETSYAQVTFADSNFFETFPQKSLYGDASQAILDARSLVLTRSAALKHFGQENAIGKTMVIEGETAFNVAAIVEDTPANRHYSASVFVNIDLIPTLWQWPSFWESNGSDQLYHYVKLQPDTDIPALENRILNYIAENFFPTATDFMVTPLQPVTDIHFNTELQNEVSLKDDASGIVKSQRQASDIYVFAIVGLLTLVIATFNFMNLQIVQITNRLKEIGIRKVLGATRRTTAYQFLIEAVILSSLAVLVGLAIAEIALPYFGYLVGSPVASQAVMTPTSLGIAMFVSLLIAICAGLYPALFAARLMPFKALRGEVSGTIAVTKIRSVLVAAQFAISAGLIIASGVIGSQVNFALSKPLGFEGNGVIKINTAARSARAAYQTLQTRIKALPFVEAVSGADIVPGQDLENGSSYVVDGLTADNPLVTRLVTVDAGAFEVLGMEVLAGRGFSHQFSADKLSEFDPDQTEYDFRVILNETAAKAAGWMTPEDAINKTLTSIFENNAKTYRVAYTVVGVVADAHYRSIRSNISPISYVWQDNAERQMLIKTARGKEQEVLTAVRQLYAEEVTDIPLRASFLETDYAEFYQGENRTFGLILSFAAIAVGIACIGLYGVTSYIVNRRIREIGIRKVLGATIAQLVALLSWNQTRMALIASLLVWPATWYFMQGWLENFSYRTEMGAMPFIYASLVTGLLAAATAGGRTYIAARMKPIDSLKHE